MKTLTLPNGIVVPLLGFGTWQLQGDECVQAVETALEVGYRHIDTADAYGNHQQVAEAIKNSGISRRELFITTKVWRDKLEKEQVIDSANRFLEELQTPYIDLLLIHWPNNEVPIEESLEGFAQLLEDKKIKAIGVSNFTIRHLQQALDTDVPVVNNQIELHPTFNQKELRQFCKNNKISITAYSPIGRANDLEQPIILRLADKYGVSPSQVILNWIISQQIIAIPKSSTRDHIEDNFKAIDWELSDDDMLTIEQIPQGERMGNPTFAEFDQE
jgi:diketogulonate reductase-like aldo/keto reductase